MTQRYEGEGGKRQTGEKKLKKTCVTRVNTLIGNFIRYYVYVCIIRIIKKKTGIFHLKKHTHIE